MNIRVERLLSLYVDIRMCSSVTQCIEVSWPEFVSRPAKLVLKGSQLESIAVCQSVTQGTEAI